MTKRALVLATETYEDARFAALPGAASDAEHLREVLGDPAVGAFEVNVLVNESMRSWGIAIEQFFGSATADDTLLLHLSCHGRKDRRNRLHFVTRDSEFDSLAATSIGADFLADCMDQSRSRRVILLLDCCYSGAFNKGMRTRGDQEVALDETFQGSGRIVITSSTALQYSYETVSLSRVEGQPSVFTSAVVHGLRTGDADLDEDGIVSVDDLYRFISRRIPEQVPDQTPTLSVSSAEGERFELARNPRAAELADRALRRALEGDPGLSRAAEQLALAEASRRTQESEARAAELSEQVKAAEAAVAHHTSFRARSTQNLTRMLGLLFSLAGGAAGLWSASLWVDGFTLPDGGGKLLALAICAVVLDLFFVAVVVGTIKAMVTAGGLLMGWIIEEEPFARHEPTGRRVLAGLRVGGGVALLLFVVAAEVIWLLPAGLRLGGWLSGLAGLPVDIRSGWSDTLATLSGIAGLFTAAIVLDVKERTPDEEIIEERNPGFVRRARYKKRWKFGPFYSYDQQEFTQGRSTDFL
ncbi:caspase domain-containing protein [Streptomyces sp. NPDC059578]|uniref:caspase family protein n=1 Tax=unclassified Streptomyces TaxID=2593676 RepID=UPI0036628028